jgi:hypothetical protein
VTLGLSGFLTYRGINVAPCLMQFFFRSIHLVYAAYGDYILVLNAKNGRTLAKSSNATH